ncbi:hypothetical protein CC79DRAFT_1324470 [Sarocladium strictum]
MTGNNKRGEKRHSHDRPADDEKGDQESARRYGISLGAKKARRSALGSRRNVRRDPNPKGSLQPDWRQRLFWIKGNAGAGKSTLLKMLVDHDKKTYTQAFVLPHFFNARGTELERSTEGMYRTLIYWILEHQPEEFAVKLDPTGTRGAIRDWAVPELERLLHDAMGMIGHSSVVFYIDALDECDEAQVREMLEYFRNLVKSAWDAGREVRVCFASRPYPHVTFDDAVFLDLSQQPEHIRDIETYINDRLTIEGAIGAAEIRRKLLMKAAGVFMWAVLVIRLLNKACDEGRVGPLLHMLEEIPPGLHKLFAHTLDRYPEDRDATLVCFRWVLFEGNSMGPASMWWAVQLGLGVSDEEIQRDYQRMNEAAMERYILGISKGLVDFNSSPGPHIRVVRFVHESVRDYLLHEGTLQKLYGVRNRTDFAGQSHELLRDCFAAELVARRPQLIEAVNERGGFTLLAEDLSKIGWTQDQKPSRIHGEGISYTTFQGKDTGDPRHPQLIEGVNESGEHTLERKRRFPLAWLASFAIWEQVEAAQQCGRDQKVYLDNVLKRICLIFLGSR